jgi:tRNA dimethylallyltransferase
MCKPLVILTGPTAVGKTALSIELAKAINGEIISADSMQVYRHMDIGTAKVTPEEMQGIPHHLIDILEPEEPFNVAEFKKRAQEAVEDILSRGKIPIVAGGTGFYIQALLYNVSFDEEENDGYRQELERIAMEPDGPTRLYQKLEQIDPDSLRTIHPNNVKRVIRALEYFHQTGEPISLHNERERAKTSPYHFAYFVLNMDRQRLYERIELRIDKMLEEGLLEEVQSLRNRGLNREHISMQGLGYKEIYDYLQGSTSLEEAIYILKRDTRHFAKRQLTWFKREKEVIWLDKDTFANENEIKEFMIHTLQKKEIIL